ncbi:MAG: hypothetical protein A3C90_03690 [Candidatus Magasanikbacteria bacterium RIFCSPHIGHO2_02_FULL_51_14]|uniref:Integral membrane protein (PIN domain superfamily) n=1 Tax=Candidatus Magasanikbacteria bacterium RIFCSPHIGHO2_02_FULL_51_14 TaxID=1798683 RepID=A0A1F6MP93_9BACT|nr:MAG: hypothetical protein A3C90_03690 [Candidatus Magasanikbacteria bacterium RIFCSPHIGHO2_02_FULL_51_14]
MDLSIFLAKVVGLYLLIIGLGMLINRKEFEPLIRQAMKDKLLIFLSGTMALLLGLLVVLSHNVWTPDWRGLITLLGWLTLLKGLMRVLLPTIGEQMRDAVMKSKNVLTVMATILAFVGLYLSIVGYVLG